MTGSGGAHLRAKHQTRRAADSGKRIRIFASGRTRALTLI
jgi:hypothetical protein